jgi:mono/diheme cytochrome c family protein
MPASLVALATALATTLATDLATDLAPALPRQATEVEFARDIAPILAAKCLSCHGPAKQKSGYRLDVKSVALSGGELSAPNIHPGDASSSPLYRYVSGADPDMEMPPRGEPLSEAEIALVRRWIDEGAAWPESASVAIADPRDWWSLKPIMRPALPQDAPSTEANPIDAFVRDRLAREGLAMAPEADARTLLRRVSFDLTGLPPTPEEIDAFVADEDPRKYEKLVDRLLASPRYGERWARHWLDVVHYADTHGYDKDKPRENAWPYRDYVIRALNEDKPYARFVEEQLAGDAIYPGTRDGNEALGFIAAGPWDFIGHEEVGEEKIDGKFARHFDRDDMVGNALGTFASVTVQCAQCHDHKFDPVPQADYYALQAVFAAVDRADRRFDQDPAVAAQRSMLVAAKARLAAEGAHAERAPEFGYHSELAASAGDAKWVAVDLGERRAFERVVLAPCSDDFNGIGDGFGFPRRFRIEASDDEAFASGVQVLAEGSDALLGTPRTNPVTFATPGARARFIRVMATELAPRSGDFMLAPRSGDFMLALAELQVIDSGGTNIAAGARVVSLDSIEMPDRWRRTNLTDGISPAARLAARAADPARAERDAKLARIEADLAALPAELVVYAGTVHTGSGSFVGTGAQGGKPREIRVLARGQVTSPGALVEPAALRMLEPALPARFELPRDAPESARRAALARWLADDRNPLVWRSIVNRVWHYHFGRGIVATPNDFGRMGGLPSHPELLDWLAATFRDEMHGSLKSLHRLIVTSSAYRQQSAVANPKAEEIDRENTLLWRANARKLEAEAVRDAVLAATGSLDLATGGPGYRDFAIERPEHSPHYRYDLADPTDAATFRRSIYRFIVRSQLQPFLTALDCADPSMRVDRRNQSLSPNQALAYLNNGFMLAQAERFAARVEREAGADTAAQIDRAVRLALGRAPSADERARLEAFAREHGLANACRVLLNLNEFSFID